MRFRTVVNKDGIPESDGSTSNFGVGAYLHPVVKAPQSYCSDCRRAK